MTHRCLIHIPFNLLFLFLFNPSTSSSSLFLSLPLSLFPKAVVKTFEVTELPVRAAKFIARKNWLIAGADDMQVRVFNYNTHEKVAVFEAHTDYIRCIAVHPTQPYVLTSSDDMSIKLWDWDNGWKNIQTFEGHSHYVMQVVFNPKDANTFASASLDRSVKVLLPSPPPPPLSSRPALTFGGFKKKKDLEPWISGGQLHPGGPREGCQLSGLLHWG